MKLKTKETISGVVFIVLFLGANTYYGWNYYPESDMEQATDVIGLFAWVLWMRYSSIRGTIEAVKKIKQQSAEAGEGEG